MGAQVTKRTIISIKQIVAMVVGIALYGVSTILLNSFDTLRVGDLFAVRPNVVIPMLFGFVFGPVVGFACGFIGNILSDTYSFQGFFWNWDIGIGLLGAIPGIGYYTVLRTDLRKLRGLALSVVLAIVASIVGIGFAVATDFEFQSGLNTFGAAIREFYFVAPTAAVNGLILTPILLYAYALVSDRRAGSEGIE